MRRQPAQPSAPSCGSPGSVVSDKNWRARQAELARRAAMTQAEVNRIESGKRMPTLRHVKCLASAFSESPMDDEPETYQGWLAILVEVGESSRRDFRAAQRA